jgi:hypothetical protein
MAIVNTIVSRLTLGNRVLVVVSALGDGTTITAASVGLQRIDTCWTQPVDEAAAPIKISSTSGSSITFDTTTAGDTNLFFLIGY